MSLIYLSIDVKVKKYSFSIKRLTHRLIKLNKTYYFRTVTKCPTHGCEMTKIWLLRKGKITRWPDIAEGSSKFPFIFFSSMAKILSALDDQSLKVSKVMSIKSATGKKRSISPSHGILSIFTRISGHLRCLAGARWNCLWVYCCIEHVFFSLQN